MSCSILFSYSWLYKVIIYTLYIEGIKKNPLHRYSKKIVQTQF